MEFRCELQLALSEHVAAGRAFLLTTVTIDQGPGSASGFCSGMQTEKQPGTGERFSVWRGLEHFGGLRGLYI